MADRYSYDISALRMLPPRPEKSNKGTFGRVLVAGGAYGMCGAACLCARAAYRSGCGLVRILTPEDNRIICQTLVPEAVLTLYNPYVFSEETVKTAVDRTDVAVCGVGLGTSDTPLMLLRTFLGHCERPTVLDADALNLISQNPDLLKSVKKNTVITPHPAEMSRLTGIPTEEIVADIPGTAERYAAAHGVICVLKDHNTAVSDGTRTVIGRRGNSGMATAGSGDVLSGIIAALLAQGSDAFVAASLGVLIHSLAGDIAASRLSEYSVTASDIVDCIPAVFIKHKNFIPITE